MKHPKFLQKYSMEASLIRITCVIRQEVLLARRSLQHDPGPSVRGGRFINSRVWTPSLAMRQTSPDARRRIPCGDADEVEAEVASLRKQPFFPHSINCTFSPLLISSLLTVGVVGANSASASFFLWPVVY